MYHQIWLCAEELRQKIRRRCDYLTPGELKRPYKHFARLQRGVDGVRLTGGNTSHCLVTANEFSDAIRDLGLRMSQDQERALFDGICRSGGSAFNYADFMVFVCDPNHEDVVWKLRRAISRQSINEKEIIAALEFQDNNASGLLTARQFKKAISSCDVELSEADATRLVQRFDSENNQRLDIEKFLRFITGLPYNDSEMINNHGTSRSGGSNDQKRILDAANPAWRAMKRKVESLLDKGYSGREIFALFDTDGKGILDVAGVQRGGRELGQALTRAEARGVLRRMNSLTRGAITRQTFYDALEIEGMRDPVDEENSRGNKDYDDDDDDDEWRNRRREGEDERAYTRRRERDKELQRERARDNYRGGSSEYDDHRPRTFDTIMSDVKKQLEDIAYDVKERRVSPDRLLRRALSKYGVARDGAVTNEEVEKAFAKLGVRVCRGDVIRIFDELDIKSSGYLDVGILADAVFPSSSGNSDQRVQGTDETYKNPQPNRRASLSLPSRDTDGLIEHIRKKMEISLGAETNSTARAKEVFSEIDRDESGAIDKTELSQAMHVLNIEMTEDELDALYRRFAIVNPAIQNSAAG